MRIKALLIFLTLFFSVAQSEAQTLGDEDEKAWGLDFSFQQYFIPEDSDLSIPTLGLTLDDWLIEGRYNYESRDAGSLWLGRIFSFGEYWEFELTPMIGSVFGTLHGIAPGFKADITWKRFNLYSEMEYVFSFETREENFFYSWSELTVEAIDWMSVGIVGNRTRAYDTSVELDRGPIIRFEIGDVSLYCAALNLDEDALIVLGFEASL